MALPRGKTFQPAAVDENADLRKRVDLAELQARLFEAQVRAFEARKRLGDLQADGPKKD